MLDVNRCLCCKNCILFLEIYLQDLMLFVSILFPSHLYWRADRFNDSLLDTIVNKRYRPPDVIN